MDLLVTRKNVLRDQILSMDMEMRPVVTALDVVFVITRKVFAAVSPGSMELDASIRLLFSKLSYYKSRDINDINLRVGFPIYLCLPRKLSACI